MVTNQHHVLNKTEIILERILPTFSLLTVCGILFGITFGVYFVFIRFDIFHAILSLMSLIVGVAAGITIEIFTRKIESKNGIK